MGHREEHDDGRGLAKKTGVAVVEEWCGSSKRLGEQLFSTNLGSIVFKKRKKYQDFTRFQNGIASKMDRKKLEE